MWHLRNGALALLGLCFPQVQGWENALSGPHMGILRHRLELFGLLGNDWCLYKAEECKTLRKERSIKEKKKKKACLKEVKN